jgi:GNAT superfamily N-acetyltransferase
MSDPNTLRIERLSPERWQEYKDLRLEALRTDPDAFGATYENSVQRPDEYWIGHLEVAQRDPNRVIFFASLEDRLVGMGGAYPEEDPANVNIVGMFVSPAWRRRGVGLALIKAIVDEVQAEQVRLCVFDSQANAVELYRNFGFATIAETPLTRADGSECTQLYMALRKG